MKKLAFIVPYFGRFPNHFELFLKSCAYNPNTDWLLFTDDLRSFSYPENVHVYPMQFDEMRKLVQKNLGFESSLENPYKLCDYKVAYGYLFREYLYSYDYWGFCDLDTLMGHIDNYLAPLMEQGYARIFTLGHLSAFQNTKNIAEAFMRPFQNEEPFRKIFSSPRIFGFDEFISNEIIRAFGTVYDTDLSANISVYHYHFHIVKWVESLKRFITEEYIPAVYLWDRGRILRCFYSEDTGQKIYNEFPYIHLQQRPMLVLDGCIKSDRIQILPDRFRPVNADEDLDILHMEKSTCNFHLFHKFTCNRLRWKAKCCINMLHPGMFNRYKL